MIKKLSNSYALCLLISAVIFASNAIGYQQLSSDFLVQLSVLFGEAVFLDFICKRFGVLGQKSHLPMLMLAILSVLILPVLSWKTLVVGLIWMSALYLSFMSKENESRSINYLIYIGILMGIAQIIDPISILLVIPFFFMFIQNTVSTVRSYVLSLIYFLMVIGVYIGVLFVMEIFDKAWNLIPVLTYDYKVFDTAVSKMFLPFVVILIVLHFLFIRNYKFRYPNRNININYMILIQVILASLIVLVTASPSILACVVIPMAILLSVAFGFNRERLIVNVAFVVLILLSISSSYLFKMTGM